MLSNEGVESSASASASASNSEEYQQQQQQQPQQQPAHRSRDCGEKDRQEQEREGGAAMPSTTLRRLSREDDGSPSQLLRRTADVEKGLLQAPADEDAPAAASEALTAGDNLRPAGVNLVESMENGRAATTAAAATSAATAGDSSLYGDEEDWFDVNEDNTAGFKYDYKEALCLDLSRAGGVAAVAAQSTPGTAPGATAATAVDAAGASRKGGAHARVNRSTNATDNGGGETTNIIASAGATGAGDEETPEEGTTTTTTATTSQNPMDMTTRGEYEMRRFSAAVAATASDDGGNNPDAPSVVGLSRRRAPMTPAVRYLMEAMCTDLQCCGECFVPHFRASHTLVRFCGFAPFEVDEGLDEGTRRFMEGENACDTGGGGGGGNAYGGEAYGRGIGLPGIAWASSRASLVEIATLTSDDSFDCGGVRLARAGQLFHTALTVPLYFTSSAGGSANNNNSINGLWEQQQLMGVVVVYFRGPQKAAASASALVRYASAVAKSAAPMSGLMVHRARFVVGRAHRIKRSWSVLVIALRFIMPALVRYHALTGRSVTEGATATLSADGSGFPAATAAVMAQMSASRHKLRAETTNRAMMVVNQPGGGTSGGRGTKAWLSQYLAKAKGGPVNLPPRVNPRDSFVTWFGTFAAIGSLELIYDSINRSSNLWGAQEDMFVLSGSFGALATILFAIPGAPLAQPRIVLSAHAFAIAVSLVAISVFEAGRAVWLQNSVTVASTILGMSLTRIVHPPAGALCLVLLGAHNKGATWERMLMLILSVVMGLAVHVAVGVGINNISPRRGYPVFW